MTETRKKVNLPYLFKKVEDGEPITWLTVTYTTHLLGDVTLIGAGAGRMETGYALLNDLLALHAERD